VYDFNQISQLGQWHLRCNLSTTTDLQLCLSQWQRALYSPDNTIGKQFQKKTKICLVHRSHSGQKGITHSNSHIIALITKFPNLSMLAMGTYTSDKQFPSGTIPVEQIFLVFFLYIFGKIYLP
jgi:hypothetical protein